jgi:hypothetical protein
MELAVSWDVAESELAVGDGPFGRSDKDTHCSRSAIKMEAVCLVKMDI